MLIVLFIAGSRSLKTFEDYLYCLLREVYVLMIQEVDISSVRNQKDITENMKPNS
jgi:hypothetical protein